MFLPSSPPLVLLVLLLLLLLRTASSPLLASCRLETKMPPLAVGPFFLLAGREHQKPLSTPSLGTTCDAVVEMLQRQQDGSRIVAGEGKRREVERGSGDETRLAELIFYFLNGSFMQCPPKQAPDPILSPPTDQPLRHTEIKIKHTHRETHSRKRNEGEKTNGGCAFETFLSSYV